MCHYHSIGQKAEFVSTVNNLAATLLEAVEKYEQKYPFNKLENAVVATESVNMMTNVYFLYGSLEAIRACVKDKCITEWGKGSLDEEVKCKGNPPLSAVVFLASPFLPI